jgi:hypothetical protein
MRGASSFNVACVIISDEAEVGLMMCDLGVDAAIRGLA